MIELSGIFGKILPQALELIDRERIIIHRRATDQREYIEIIEDHNSIFKLMPYTNYCMCIEFQEKVLLCGEQYTCKHVLAARLAGLIDKIKIIFESDDEFNVSIQLIQPTSFESNDD